jgi:hypothetical protein
MDSLGPGSPFTGGGGYGWSVTADAARLVPYPPDEVLDSGEIRLVDLLLSLAVEDTDPLSGATRGAVLRRSSPRRSEPGS